MISVCQLYNDFKGENNTWQQGHYRPQSFIFALHVTQIEIFNELRKEWEKSQIVSDNLKPFFESVQVPIKDFPKGGIVSYPDNYSTFSSLRFFSKTVGGRGVICEEFDVLAKNDKGKICIRPMREEEKADATSADDLFERQITKVDNQRWGAACEHVFIPPDIDNPICTQNKNGFKVLPKGIGYVVLDYLAIPKRPTLIYTRDKKHNIICDPDKCTNLLWGEEMLPEIMSRLKTKYASFINNQQKYAEGRKETETVGS